MIAEKIRQYIKDKDINQTAIGRKAGLTKQAMSDSMRGVRRLTADEYVGICGALGVSTDFFAESDGEEDT